MRASRFSLELKSWSTRSSSYRMFRVSKYATNISENACSRCSTSIMDLFSMRMTEQLVIAAAELIRRGCPVRQPSPKKSPLVQNADGGFLPALRYDGESYLPFL